MDPTAPKDSSLTSDPVSPQDAGSTPNPIQPGQFVVTGEAEPQALVPGTSSPQNKITEPPPVSSAGNIEPPLPTLGASPSAQASAPVNLASAQQPTPPPVSPSNQSGLPPIPPSQPDPTPFMPQPTSPPPTQESSKMGKIKLLLFIAAGVALVGLIGAVVWLFVLGGNKPKEPIKTESTQEQLQEQPPVPKRTEGGFGELPQATAEATGGSDNTFPVSPETPSQ